MLALTSTMLARDSELTFILTLEYEEGPFFDEPGREAEAKEMGAKLFCIPILVNHSITTISKAFIKDDVASHTCKAASMVDSIALLEQVLTAPLRELCKKDLRSRRTKLD
jgi:hypothetical protein